MSKNKAAQLLNGTLGVGGVEGREKKSLTAFQISHNHKKIGKSS